MTQETVKPKPNLRITVSPIPEPGGRFHKEVEEFLSSFNHKSPDIKGMTFDERPKPAEGTSWVQLVQTVLKHKHTLNAVQSPQPNSQFSTVSAFDLNAQPQAHQDPSRPKQSSKIDSEYLHMQRL